jgi:hypothetical protein
MQLVLWVILGGTLGLAQVITAQRHGIPIALQQPEWLGPLLVSLPEDWAVSQDSEPGQNSLTAEDAEGGREMTIAIEPLPGPGRVVSRIEFKRLSQTGVLTLAPALRRAPDDSVVPGYELVASTTLPSVGAVTIRLFTRRPSSEDKRLIQAVANGITLSEGLPPKARPRSVPLHPDDFD